MKNNNWVGKAVAVIPAFTAVLLAGCTVTYVQPTPPPVVYTAPPPAPADVPPAVEQQPPVVYVAPQPEPEPAVVEIRTESDFYEPLSRDGRWVDVAGYGRCWIPSGVDPDWRPYTNGHWQRTDAGWYWVSDESWGWATYHYGRWHLDVNFGWVWVPQTLWAPAWVSWREGGGYTGWAPLPPEARMGARGELEFRYEAIEPRAFVFVEQRRLMEPHRERTVIVNNTTIINNTVNITKVQVVNKTVINEGPRPEAVERASGHKVEVLPVHQVRATQEARAVAVQRNTPAAAERKPQPVVRSHPEIPAQKAQPANPPHPVAVKPVPAEQNFARPQEKVAQPEVKRPWQNAEHKPAAEEKAHLPNPPHPVVAKPVTAEQNVVRPQERATPPEARKSWENAEHKPAPKPVVEAKKPEIQAPKPRPEFVETPRPAAHPEPKPETRFENQHEATLKKPVQPTLTAQQKLAQEKKKQAEEKKRLEEEKSARPPQ